MTRYGVAEAKDSLSSLIDLAMAGETVQITRHGQPMVELKPLRQRMSADAAARRKATEELIESMRDMPPLEISAAGFLDEMYSEE